MKNYSRYDWGDSIKQKELDKKIAMLNKTVKLKDIQSVVSDGGKRIITFKNGQVFKCSGAVVDGSSIPKEYQCMDVKKNSDMLWK